MIINIEISKNIYDKGSADAKKNIPKQKQFSPILNKFVLWLYNFSFKFTNLFINYFKRNISCSNHTQEI